MASAKLKTKPNSNSVSAFLAKIKDERRRKDSMTVLRIMKSVTRSQPKLWGKAVVGFGSYHYKYPSGREGDWFLTGFSPRKDNLTLYIMPGFREHTQLMKKLGNSKPGSSCLYVKSLDGFNMKTLKMLIGKSVAELKKRSAP